MSQFLVKVFAILGLTRFNSVYFSVNSGVIQGSQQIFKIEFQDFPGLFELKTFIFPGLNLFFPGLIQAAKDFLHAYVRNNFVPAITNEQV